jgi:hypothetical protein
MLMTIPPVASSHLLLWGQVSGFGERPCLPVAFVFGANWTRMTRIKRRSTRIKKKDGMKVTDQVVSLKSLLSLIRVYPRLPIRVIRVPLLDTLGPHPDPKVNGIVTICQHEMEV